jgi:hypothetical protein
MFWILSVKLAARHANQLEETPDFDEWIGESRLHTRLIEKMQTLQEVQFAD